MTTLIWVGSKGDMACTSPGINKTFTALPMETIFTGITVLDPKHEWETPSLLVYIYVAPTCSELRDAKNETVYQKPRTTFDGVTRV